MGRQSRESLNPRARAVEPARNIVWIASYPKSGNTWVRFMACNLLHGAQDSAAGLSLLAPDIHEIGAQRLAAHSGLVKTHFPYSDELPLAERTAGVIYVVRHPADVLVSNFHYAQRSARMDNATRQEFDRYVERFIQFRGDPRWIELGMGSWEANVRSWLGQLQPFPVVAMRYEALSADPKKTCRTMAQVFRPGSSDAEIEATVQNSCFNRLREIEAADIREQRIGIFYKPYLQAAIDSGRRFMRRGTVGDGAQLLSAEQQARLAGTFAPLLAQLGYQSP
jgi:Sulfotransferase domain